MHATDVGTVFCGFKCSRILTCDVLSPLPVNWVYTVVIEYTVMMTAGRLWQLIGTYHGLIVVRINLMLVYYGYSAPEF